MGARVLSGWLGHPLLDSDAIEQRLEAVTALVDRRGLRRSIREGLAGLPDLERLGGRAGQRLLTPREALALADGLERATELRRVVDDSLETEVWLGSLAPRLDLPDHLPEEIRATLADDATRDFGEGLIRPGRVPELDALRGESSRGRDWLLTLERAERERTGVKNLKVGYNRVFGYYLEVSTAALKQELDYYRREETRARTVAELLTALGYERRQTLASVERYVTAELREHEARQSRSTTRMAQLEREAFDALVQRAASEAPRLMLAGTAFGELDALACMADVADERGYVRPEIVVEPDLELEGGRHPMVEASLGWDAYLPADLHLRALDSVSPPAEDPTHPGCVMVLTGPNMAGKTTYGRMALLVVVLAQSGCFVPATRARVGLVDRVFLRSGAGDDISGGRSTFMTEMTETSAILRQVTPRSLAFFDEVGRGTSTYDGMAIARAIVEYLAQPPRGCRTIFSTHYHELAEVERHQPGVRNRRMEVEELADRVVFTYRVEPGAADRSYGVHVAELAGLPTEVVHRAHYLLAELERGEVSARPASNVPPAPSGEAALARRLASIDVERLTPIEALNVLADLRRRAADLAGDDADIS
jgi:DNA mismatch repair protein MutS